jgi:hypothetical protein
MERENMTPANIEEMVAVIAGSFPLDNVFKPDVCKAWQRHDLISNMSVEEGRAVQKRVVNFCDHFPSTHDIVKAYWMLFGKKPTECRTCDSTGWVVPRDEEGNRLTYPGRNYLGRPVHYTYVLQCWNCNGGT